MVLQSFLENSNTKDTASSSRTQIWIYIFRITKAFVQDVWDWGLPSIIHIGNGTSLYFRWLQWDRGHIILKYVYYLKTNYKRTSGLTSRMSSLSKITHKEVYLNKEVSTHRSTFTTKEHDDVFHKSHLMRLFNHICFTFIGLCDILFFTNSYKIKKKMINSLTIIHITPSESSKGGKSYLLFSVLPV